MMIKNINLEIQTLLSAIKEAGVAILAMQTSFDTTHKDCGDLLTSADMLANDILKNRLLQQFPQDGWLSEETVDDMKRLDCQRVWIVDPIDGTKEYVEGIAEYAISVALIEHGIPIVAAVFNPATDELFYAIKGKGAWLAEKQLHHQPAHEIVILASRTEYERGAWMEYAKQYPIKKIGSIAYKMALVAAGQASATFSLGPKNEWDIAAGALLVTEAGGRVMTKHKKPLSFNQRNTLVDSIIAVMPSAEQQVFDLIGFTAMQ